MLKHMLVSRRISQMLEPKRMRYGPMSVSCEPHIGKQTPKLTSIQKMSKIGPI